MIKRMFYVPAYISLYNHCVRYSVAYVYVYIYIYTYVSVFIYTPAICSSWYYTRRCSLRTVQRYSPPSMNPGLSDRPQVAWARAGAVNELISVKTMCTLLRHVTTGNTCFSDQIKSSLLIYQQHEKHSFITKISWKLIHQIFRLYFTLVKVSV